MKQLNLKWKTHGLIVVTLFIVIILAKYLWIILFGTGGLNVYEMAFEKNQLTYDKFRNFLAPQTGVLLLFYGAYLWLNFITIPTLFRSKSWLAYPWIALQIGILGYLLALGVNVASYFAKPYLYSYGPLFLVYAFFGYNDKPLQDLTFGLSSGVTFTAFCTAYLAAKEYFIIKAKNSPKRSYQFSRMNLINTLLILYITVPFFCAAFHLVDDDAIYRVYFAVLILASFGYALQHNRRKVMLKRSEKALNRSKADLQFLRSQINPHFLFNVLNTLYGTALIDGSKRTAEGIQKLGDMMRFMLHENHLDSIPLSREIAYLHNYIALQKLRIQDESITLEVAIDENAGSKTIVPMLLIPFVENAFKHGVQPPEKSWIKISLICTAQEIRFEVRNSWFSATENDPEAEYSGIGLSNVRERLNLFYPNKHVLNYGVQHQEFVAELIINTSAK